MVCLPSAVILFLPHLPRSISQRSLRPCAAESPAQPLALGDGCGYLLPQQQIPRLPSLPTPHAEGTRVHTCARVGVRTRCNTLHNWTCLGGGRLLAGVSR